MKFNIRKVVVNLLSIGTILLASGCSSKAQIVTYSLPEINTKNQTIAIEPFGYDNLNIKSSLEYELNNTYINGLKYFSLTNNFNTANILIKGSLSGIDQSFRKYDSYNVEEICFTEDRRRNDYYNDRDNYNSNYRNQPDNYNNYNRNYNYQQNNRNPRDEKITCYKKPITCFETTYAATLYVDITQHNFNKRYSFSATETRDTCSGYNYQNDYISSIRDSLVSQLANVLKPVKNVQYIEFKEDLFGKYNSKINNLQEDFISFTKNGEWDRALFVNNQIKNLTSNNDFVPFYNEGLIFESKNQLTEAKNSYSKALNLNSSDNDKYLINSSLNRVNDSLLKKSLL